MPLLLVLTTLTDLGIIYQLGFKTETDGLLGAAPALVATTRALPQLATEPDPGLA